MVVFITVLKVDTLTATVRVLTFLFIYAINKLQAHTTLIERG